MRIKRSVKRSFPARILFQISSFFKHKRRRKIAGLSMALILFFAACLGFLWKKGLIEKVTRNVPYIIRGFFINPPERITIDIKFEDYQKLAKKREEAITKTGILLKGPDDYVPAVITNNGKKVKVDLRLKGDYIGDHLVGDKWSFRVKVKDDNTLFGMRKFSLHRPRARWYVNEWVYHKLLRREGLIALRYKFINVTVNGRDLGLYALEEHFGKHLIENNRRREGIVIRSDEDLFLRNRMHHGGSPLVSGSENLGYNVAEIRSFEMGRILKNPDLMEQFKTALELAGRLRNGELKLSEVFDIPKLAKYYAVSDLIGAVHSTQWPNFIIYYNPVTSKFEPVAFDAENALNVVKKLTPERFMEGDEKKNSDLWWGTQHIFHLWEDEEFTRNYLGELERVTKASYVDEIIKDIEEPLKDNISYLWNLGLEGIESQSFRFVCSRLHQNASAIRKKLDVVKGLHAYFAKVSNQTLVLTIANIDTIPFAIERITCRGADIFKPQGSLILPPRKIFSPVRYQQYDFPLPDDFQWNDEMIPDVFVHYSVPGTSIRKKAEVFAWNFLDNDFFKEDFIREKPNFRNVKFFRIDQASRTIFVKPGVWDLHESIIIPSGWTVIARRGVTLNLEKGAKILSYSPFEWIGDEDEPVQIMSKDKAGQGIAIMNTQSPSSFKYVIFKDLSNPRQGGWALTGSVTFYEAEVHISHCQFLNNRSEDSLNIIRSEFLIEESLFRNAAFDAVDFDFSKGEIKRTSFLNSGNDAIDFSGSMGEVSDIFISRAGDKGVSIGEESTIEMNNLIIKECAIAVASKDSSQATIKKINISDSKRAFAAYQKKPEFGPTTLTVENLTLSKVISPYLVEEQSHLTIEGQAIVSNPEEVKQFLLDL